MSARTAIRGSLPYVIAIVSGFLLAYLIVAFLVFPSGVIPRDARVPNVTGLLFDEATRRLAERGFRGQRGEERFHGGAPKETVLEQSPAAGSHDVEGTVVTLAVSAGQKLVAVPNVVGLSREGAETELESAGFDVGEVTEQPNPAPHGQVIESRPAPGTQAPMPSTVSLVVSAGSSVVAVPNVVGRSVADARRMIEGARLGVGDVSATDGSNVETGVVSSQSPTAGAQVAVGARVSLLTRTKF
jgi:serine/threonine-protein kinase